MYFRPCDLPKGHPSPSLRVLSRFILNGHVPIYHRIYSPGELQFIATSTYRRVPIFRSERFCHTKLIMLDMSIRLY